MTDIPDMETSAPPAAPPAAAQWQRVLPALAVLLLGVGAAFFESFHAMERIWARSDTFAHAYVVLPISLWLIWRQRQALARQMPRPEPWMLLPMAFVAAAWTVGQLAAANVVMQFSATAMLVLVVPLVIGLRAASVILFPLVFLFFAVPFGEFMIPSLMQGTADFTVAALRLSGVPVYREGMQFVIPSGKWSVVEECSGVRYLMASFMVGSLFAYLNYRSWPRRAIFAVASLVAPVLANWVRAYLIVMLGHLSGNKLAAGADHLLYGWVFFGIVITALFMVGARWSEAPEEVHTAPARRAAGAKSVWVAAVLGIGMAFLPQFVLGRLDAAQAGAPPRLDLQAMKHAGGWQPEATSDPLWRPAYESPPAQDVVRLAAPDGSRIGLYIAYFRHQQGDAKLISSQNKLVTSQDRVWNAVDSQLRTQAVGGRTLTLRQTQILPVDKSGGTDREGMLAWHFYWVDDELLADELRAKMLGLRQRLSGRGDDAAAVVIYAADRPGAPAQPVLERYLRDNLAAIEQALRATRERR